MKRVSSKLLALLTVLLGLPVTIAVVRAPSLLLPGLLGVDAGLPGLEVSLLFPHVGFFGVLVFCALCQYWLLAIRTAHGNVHPFRKVFWVGLFAALLYSILESARATPFPDSLLLIWGGTLYLLAAQLRLRALPQATYAYVVATLGACRPNYPAIGLGVLLCLSIGWCSRPRDTSVNIHITLVDAEGALPRGRATAEFFDANGRFIARAREDEHLRSIFLASGSKGWHPGSLWPAELLRARSVRIEAPGCKVSAAPFEFIRGFWAATCTLTDIYDEPIICSDTTRTFRMEWRVRLNCE